MAFHGFPKETTTFLANLSRNNSKDWFEKHKPQYKELVEAPAKEFRAEMEERLSDLVARPLTGKNFRIYRDVRFSKDKTPYNPHIRMLFHESEMDSKCGNRPVFCFSLEPKSVITGAGTGTMEFSGPTLDSFRNAVAADTSGKALEKLIKKFSTTTGFRVDPPALKKVPRGFEADHPRADLLKHKALMVWHEEALSAPIHSAKCAAHLTKSFKTMKPVMDWIDTHVKAKSMPFDEGLATRLEDVIRSEFGHVTGLEETRMFGGFGYLLNGNMCVGIHKDTLIIRVGEDTATALIQNNDHVRPMDFTGRVMKAWATIEPDAMEDDADLARFVGHAIEFVSELPVK